MPYGLISHFIECDNQYTCILVGYYQFCNAIHVVILQAYTSMLMFHCFTLSLLFADAVATGNAFFGSGAGPIQLDQVNCSGTESILGACLANPIGIHTCTHAQDAGVSCRSEW